MARVKPLTQEDRENRKFLGAIKYGMECEGKNNYDMANAMGLNYVTWTRRLKDPRSFRLCEIRKLKRILPTAPFDI